ncbi:MAG: aldehyde dehydrogenase family protein [Bacteroidetes bacterium]|nr:aldehyde dehydrogenase family protein [Bacteroidota bacterium]
MNTHSLLDSLGISGRGPGLAIGESIHSGGAPPMDVCSPIDGSLIQQVGTATPAEVEAGCQAAHEAFLLWRNVPAPRRGELVRQFGQVLREYKEELGALITLEAGKIRSEAEGEVQEMIDVCDFATGLSRQLYGLTIQSERPQHRLMEQWHPLGAVGVISAFNFPVAVWSWNAALALVCGDPVVWKPSEKTPLCALACHNLLMKVIRDFEDAPDALSVVVNGGRVVGEALVDSPKLPLISATGSIAMGRAVGQRVARRLGRSLLELGGNNALIVASSADLDLAVKAITFAAVGTAGQRCTTLRRLIVHKSIKGKLVSRLLSAWASIRIGDPRDAGVLVGPLIDDDAAIAMDTALALAIEQEGKVHGGGRVTAGVPAGGTYVHPALVEIPSDARIVQTETFAPICYVHEYDQLEEAIDIQNGVPQGLASAIFTDNVLEAEIFCGPSGSDCGIANVNIGTSGAEIGGAFGGEKETGGGRESGSDAWKNYMRRATNTINYGKNLPLAQGVEFV